MNYTVSIGHLCCIKFLHCFCLFFRRKCDNFWTLGGEMALPKNSYLTNRMAEQETLTVTCLNSTFSNKLFIDIWCITKLILIKWTPEQKLCHFWAYFLRKQRFYEEKWNKSFRFVIKFDRRFSFSNRSTSWKGMSTPFLAILDQIWGFSRKLKKIQELLR